MDSSQLRYCLVVFVILIGLGAAIAHRKPLGESAETEPETVAEKRSPAENVFSVAAPPLLDPQPSPPPATTKLSGGIAAIPPLEEEGVESPAPSATSLGRVERPISVVQERTRRHRVADGDTLESLALHYYGDAALAAALFEANRDLLKTPDLLPVGRAIDIPAKSDAASGAIAKSPLARPSRMSPLVESPAAPSLAPTASPYGEPAFSDPWIDPPEPSLAATGASLAKEQAAAVVDRSVIGGRRGLQPIQPGRGR